jgi:hypothetical protein
MSILGRAKEVISRKALRTRVAAEFLLVAQMSHTGRGRPRLSVLGAARDEADGTHRAVRKTLDILTGVEVLDAVLKDMAAKQQVLDHDLAVNLGPKAKREFVAELLRKMSRVTPVATIPGAEHEAWFKSTGPLLRIRKHEPAKRNGAGQFMYVARDTATAVEVLAAMNSHDHRAQSRMQRDSAITEIFAAAIAKWPDGMTAMEAYAHEVESRLARR